MGISSRNVTSWVLSTGFCPLGTGVPGPARKYCPVPLHRLQVLSGPSGPVRNLFQCWLSMGSRLLQGTSTACRWISSPPCAGDNQHPHSFLHGIQENLYFSACSSPTLYFSTSLCVCRAVLLIDLFLSPSCSFSLFLKLEVAEVLPLSLFYSALANDGSILNWLKQALYDFSKKSPLQPSCLQNLSP